MNESMRVLVSGRFTLKPEPELELEPSRRPDTTSKLDVGEEVGEEAGDEGEIEIAVLIFVVRVRKMGILYTYRGLFRVWIRWDRFRFVESVWNRSRNNDT